MNNNNVLSKSDKRKGIRKVAIKSLACFFGYFIAVGPFVAVAGLQSSINIEESVGTKSLGVAYAVSFLTSLFVTPSFIRRFGCKYALLVGEVSHVLFIAANFYPVSYMMLAAGLINGVGESMIWTAMPMFSQYFGIKQSKYGTKRRTYYIEKYNGFFCGCYYIGQVFGFIAAYALLYVGKVEHGEQQQLTNMTVLNNTDETFRGINSHSNTTDVNYLFGDEYKVGSNPYEYCGSRDCQDPNVTKSRIDHYVPTDKTFLHLLLGLFCMISLLGIALHVRFLPTAKPEEFCLMIEESEKPLDPGNTASENQEQPTTIATTLVSTFCHAFNPKQMLLMPLLLHGGLFYGFYLSEASRAFTSCVLGVEKVGLALVVFSSCCVVSSFSSGKVIGFFGRNAIVPALLIIDLSNYVVCLLWRPQENTSSLVFVIFAVMGVTDSGWRSCSLSAYADYFPKNQEIALTLWNFYISAGIAISFCWSPILCVGTKIYIQAALLTTGALTYGMAEILFRREKRVNSDLEAVTDEQKVSDT